MATQVISWFASIALALTLVPQVIRIIKRRSSKDVSLFTILCFVVGNGIWVIYAALKIASGNNNFIQLLSTNVVLSSFGWIMLVFKIRGMIVYKNYLNYVEQNPEVMNLTNEQLRELVETKCK
ncbi:hypothetical protein SCHIN_v1c04130 [Spiroplasma chinense]|uniref:MtN3 and saliva related transmembrane protein n=1 Tax=Spiroplasma chinense TaxID=216932 RepID=A0A5B9Y3T3_9MOLU|nr:PQ-loop domain-containing transporter [Spiroplasma chinense]QEH61610.1 hypothetical protein SCHIN_v1c04130 [Spiroplasma chinense]